MRFTYHSEHHADRQDRWIHFLLFAGAVFLLLCGSYELFLFFTDWSAAEDDHPWRYLIFALIYLTVGAFLLFAGLRHVRAKDHPEDRFLTVDDEKIRWSLTQGAAVSELRLEELAGYERPNVRDLVLRTKSGVAETVPIYLIANEEKQGELLSVLDAALVEERTA